MWAEVSAARDAPLLPHPRAVQLQSVCCEPWEPQSRDFGSKLGTERTEAPGDLTSGNMALCLPAGCLPHPQLRAPWSSTSRALRALPL